MAILTDALKGKITWATAAGQIVAWGEKIIGMNPAATQLVGAAVADAKQFASDAITLADDELGQYIAPATLAAEAALEAALEALTKGASLPFNPLITSGIDRFATAVKNAADLWALQAKASLNGSPSSAAGSSSAS